MTGIEYFNPKTSEFELRFGPVVANILLADEINRAMPRTQSSLLEAMEERQVTLESSQLLFQNRSLLLRRKIQLNHKEPSLFLMHSLIAF